MNDHEIKDERRLPIIFIHSSMDDAGLSAEAFRVYAHIARRAGTGQAWPSIDSMMEKCGLGKRPILRALRELIDRNMIMRRPRPGYTSLYILTDQTRWTGGGAELDPGPIQQGGVVSKQHRGVVSKQHHEGNTIKTSNEEKIYIVQVDPEKSANGSNEPQPISKSTAEQIYDLYPRKVGKPAALRAIAIALRSTPPQLLEDAVRRYAEVVAGWPDHQRIYIPHAATWINQRRWEDAETFAPKSAPPQGGRPASYNAAPTSAIDPTIF